MFLCDVKKNVYYKILGYENAVDGISRRFMELGLVAGEKVRVTYTSLQKKVFLIEVRGYMLSVRAELLKKVRVEVC